MSAIPAEFQDRVVIVSGATGGIGSLACRAFAAAGARVVGIDRDAVSGAKLQHSIEGHARAFTFRTVDVASPQQVAAFAGGLGQEVGHVDVLINNAGVLGMCSILETTVEEWDRLQTVNLRSVFLMTKAVAPLLSEGSVILNMSSSAALHPVANTAAYSVSKAGIVTFSKIAAAELAPRTRVNAICPGPLDTPMPHNFLQGHPLKDDIMKAMIDSTLMKRLGKPEEIVDLLIFLAGKKATYITGAVFAADGGFTS